MKTPQAPPTSSELFAALLGDPARLARVMGRESPSATIAGRYLHWDELRFRSPPKGLTLEEWWARIKFARGATTKELPFRDEDDRPFVLASPDVLQRQLHEADRDLSGRVELPEQLTTPGIRDRYQTSALIEEAITSSQLEGAATTRRVAREMLQSGRKPRTHDELMIFNNYVAMESARSVRDEPLTTEIVLRLHREVTDGTLDDPSASGRLRNASESGAGWGVYAPDDILLHQPPPAPLLPARLASLCEFANDRSSGEFIHPIVRSILLHFWIGYDHPFVDGNGRTARALFYWSMLHHGYWLAEFLSVSHILRTAPAKYARAYLYTETDDNDATYFVLYQMHVLRRSIAALLEYVRAKAAEAGEVQELLRSSALNHRQIALLSHALRNPRAQYATSRHASGHGVTRQTARTDLRELAHFGLLVEAKRGRKFVFSVPPDLESRLERLDSLEAGTKPERPRGPGRPPRPSRRPPLSAD